MGDRKANGLGFADHRTGRRGAAQGKLNAMAEGFALLAEFVEQHIHHDWRAAHVRNTVALDTLMDYLGVDAAQADMGATNGGNGPGVGPAVAVEHRQGP